MNWVNNNIYQVWVDSMNYNKWQQHLKTLNKEKDECLASINRINDEMKRLQLLSAGLCIAGMIFCIISLMVYIYLLRDSFYALFG